MIFLGFLKLITTDNVNLKRRRFFFSIALITIVQYTSIAQDEEYMYFIRNSIEQLSDVKQADLQITKVDPKISSTPLIVSFEETINEEVNVFEFQNEKYIFFPFFKSNKLENVFFVMYTDTRYFYAWSVFNDKGIIVSKPSYKLPDNSAVFQGGEKSLPMDLLRNSLNYNYLVFNLTQERYDRLKKESGVLAHVFLCVASSNEEIIGYAEQFLDIKKN